MMEEVGIWESECPGYVIKKKKKALKYLFGLLDPEREGGMSSSGEAEPWELGGFLFYCRYPGKAELTGRKSEVKSCASANEQTWAGFGEEK